MASREGIGIFLKVIVTLSLNSQFMNPVSLNSPFMDPILTIQSVHLIQLSKRWFLYKTISIEIIRLNSLIRTFNSLSSFRFNLWLYAKWELNRLGTRGVWLLPDANFFAHHSVVFYNQHHQYKNTHETRVKMSLSSTYSCTSDHLPLIVPSW